MTQDPTQHEYEASDGVRLTWHEAGDPADSAVILLHGLFSNAETNWIRFGHSAAIAKRGFRVIMPDLRAHGQSDAPHSAEAYPPDVLARDGIELIRHLGLDRYDLGGYSLGGRTAVRMVIEGARPNRLIISGMGLKGLLRTGGSGAHFRKVLTGLGSHERGSAEWLAEAFLKTTGADTRALLLLLDSFVDSSEEELHRIDMPVLVLSGVEDKDNGPSKALADFLANAVHVEVPGNHMSAVTKPELGSAIADFLGG